MIDLVKSESRSDSSPLCGKESSIREAKGFLRSDELAYLVNESVFKGLFNGQDFTEAMPLSDLFGASSGSPEHDGFVGLLIPVHLLDILLQFCASELGLRFECPSRSVYEEATGRVGVSAGTGEEYRDSTGINNTCAVCQELEIEGDQVVIDGESGVVGSSSRTECQIHHFRRVLLDQIRSEITESTRRLLIDLGMKVDEKGRFFFGRADHSGILRKAESSSNSKGKDAA